MRTLKRNKRGLQYSNLITKETEVKTDSEGNILKTGGKETVYSIPDDLKGNIVDKNVGDTKAMEYGIDKADCDAVMLLEVNSHSLRVGSLIWRESEPKTDSQGNVLKSSADFIVKKISPTLNVDRIILKRLVNGKCE